MESGINIASPRANNSRNSSKRDSPSMKYFEQTKPQSPTMFKNIKSPRKTTEKGVKGSIHQYYLWFCSIILFNYHSLKLFSRYTKAAGNTASVFKILLCNCRQSGLKLLHVALQLILDSFDGLGFDSDGKAFDLSKVDVYFVFLELLHDFFVFFNVSHNLFEGKLGVVFLWLNEIE